VHGQEDLACRPNRLGVRDPALSEALQRLAAEAATRFNSLVATGDEIPFDVAEDAGEQTLFYRYVPLTAKYVAEREAELRSLPSFGPACDAVTTAEVAAPYLEARGLSVPADADDRAAKMLVAFIAALWDGCGEFRLDHGRVEQALAALDAEARDVHEADVLIAPIVGLQLPVGRLELPNGIRVLSAETVEAPIEAMRSEGMHRNAWEPQFLALADQGDGREGTDEALRQLHDLISVLRLFKEGGVGLGPHAFAPTGSDKWRRITTGAAATRPGGYKLTETEVAELKEFATLLEARPDPQGALRWAIARFELGCERPSVLEGLSDHLLALGALLEGGGPVGASLEIRASALIAGTADRVEARERVERAFALERSLIRGSVLVEEDEESGSAIEIACWLEDGLRAILRDAALAEGSADVCETADEILIGAGLDAGDGGDEQRGETAEWEAIPEDHEMEEPDPTRILEPIPGEDEIRVTSWAGIEVKAGDRDEPAEDPPEDDHELEPDPPEEELELDQENEMIDRDWLSEVARDATLEWPAAEGERRPSQRERIDTPRVRHLFPVPDDADWSVRELEYRRRAGVR
jgi:hypothetical protein